MRWRTTHSQPRLPVTTPLYFDGGRIMQHMYLSRPSVDTTVVMTKEVMPAQLNMQQLTKYGICNVGHSDRKLFCLCMCTPLGLPTLDIFPTQAHPI